MTRLGVLLAGVAITVAVFAAGWQLGGSSPATSNGSLANPGLTGGGSAGAAASHRHESADILPHYPVVTAAAMAENVAVTKQAVGWIEPTASVDIQPRIEGEIVELWAVEGQMVKAGDPLFRLDDREIRARIARSEAILARDRARLARAVAGLNTIRKLVEKAAASQSQSDQAAADVEVLAAESAASEASLLLDTIALDHATVRAPIDGRIGAIGVTRGSFVYPRGTTADPLLTITRMQPVAVSFALPDRDLDLLRATIEDDAQDRVQVFSSGSDQRLGAGAIIFMDSAIDPKSGTVLVRALLANEDGRLWPGQYVRVSVDLGPQRDVVTVPMAAVIHGDQDPFIFVAGRDGKAERRLVELGEARGERAVVTSGVKPGERVVVEGQWRLHEGASISGGAEHPVNVADREAGSGGRGQ